MTANTIANGKNRPVNVQTGTVPDVSGALKDLFQLLTFERVEKVPLGFQVLERGVITSFWGMVAWTWLLIHAEPSLSLNVDEVIFFLGSQTRVMARVNYSEYGYQEYHVIQDYTGSGPSFDE